MLTHAALPPTPPVRKPIFFVSEEIPAAVASTSTPSSQQTKAVKNDPRACEGRDNIKTGRTNSDSAGRTTRRKTTIKFSSMTTSTANHGGTPMAHGEKRVAVSKNGNAPKQRILRADARNTTASKRTVSATSADRPPPHAPTTVASASGVQRQGGNPQPISANASTAKAPFTVAEFHQHRQRVLNAKPRVDTRAPSTGASQRRGGGGRAHSTPPANGFYFARHNTAPSSLMTASSSFSGGSGGGGASWRSRPINFAALTAPNGGGGFWRLENNRRLVSENQRLLRKLVEISNRRPRFGVASASPHRTFTYQHASS